MIVLTGPRCHRASIHRFGTQSVRRQLDLRHWECMQCLNASGIVLSITFVSSPLSCEKNSSCHSIGSSSLVTVLLILLPRALPPVIPLPRTLIDSFPMRVIPLSLPMRGLLLVLGTCVFFPLFVALAVVAALLSLLLPVIKTICRTLFAWIGAFIDFANGGEIISFPLPAACTGASLGLRSSHRGDLKLRGLIILFVLKHGI